MRSTVENKIDMAIEQELSRANELHPPFVDMHHAFAVMLEEYEEAMVEVEAMESWMESYWEATKKDDFVIGEKIAREMIGTMQRCLTEMIQLAAMVQKTLAMHNETNKG